MATATGCPHFGEQEFRGFLMCGVLSYGFTRLRGTDCMVVRLVAFSPPARLRWRRWR